MSVTGISLSKESLLLNEGDTEGLSVTIEPGNASNTEVIWASSNDSVAAVNNGLVTAVASGSATITVTTVDEGLSASCLVVFSEKAPESTTPKLTIGTVSGKAGEMVEIPVVLSQAPNLKAVAVSGIEVDSSVMELTGFTWKVTDSVIAEYDVEKNIGVLTVKANSDLNGTLFALKFKIKEDVSNCEVIVNCAILAKEKPGAVEQNVDVIVISGKVVVQSLAVGDINNDGTITSDDAVYLLYNTLLPEIYPVSEQNLDFNGDGEINTDDAIYLLYHTLLPDIYPLKNT